MHVRIRSEWIKRMTAIADKWGFENWGNLLALGRINIDKVWKTSGWERKNGKYRKRK